MDKPPRIGYPAMNVARSPVKGQGRQEFPATIFKKSCDFNM
jgi:hypothetical protein